jgi:hypothetical protein
MNTPLLWECRELGARALVKKLGLCHPCPCLIPRDNWYFALFHSLYCEMQVSLVLILISQDEHAALGFGEGWGFHPEEPSNDV